MLTLLLTASLAAAPPAEGTFTVSVGDWAVTFSASGAWAVSKVAHGGHTITTSAGAHGTALDIGRKADGSPGSGWIGGTLQMGGVEEVSDLTVTADGTELPVTDGGKFAGQRVTVVKTSKLAALEQVLTTDLTPDRITETVALKALESQPACSLYLFMHNWSTGNTGWLAETSAGKLESGEFSDSKANFVRQPARWAALYDPAEKLGVLTACPEVIKPELGAPGMVLWDTSGYRKQYFHVIANTTLEQGWTTSASIVTQVFQAEPDGWPAAAEQQARVICPKLTPQAVAEAADGLPMAGQFSVVVGKWTVAFAADRAWTIHHLDYDGRKVSHENGFHGCVIATGIPKIPGNGSSFVGTGHTEGGREQVESVVLTLDGKEVPVQVDQEYQGQTFKLVKHSMIDRLKHTAELTLTADGILEHHRLEATEEQPCAIVYLFMHCWEPFFTKWAAEQPDGTPIEGEFLSDKDFEINQDVKWSAIYDPATNVGMVTSYPEVYESKSGKGLGTRYWDLDRYHKQYLHLRGAKPIPAGDVIEGTLRLQAVEAQPDEWVAAAKKLAEQPFN